MELNALTAVSPIDGRYHGKTKGLADLSQGEVSIKGADERPNVEYWNSHEGESMYKKMRLVVRASFLH